MKWLISIALPLLLFVGYGFCSRILGVFPMPAHSHFTLGFKIMKELADRGHEVHFINPFPQKEKIKNLHDVSVAELVVPIQEKIKADLYKFGEMSFMDQLTFVRYMGNLISEEVLKLPIIQNLLSSNESFDLVILENFFAESLTIFQHKFQSPLVILAPGPPTTYNNYLFANPSPSSYVTNMVSGMVPPLNFWGRTKNLFYDIVEEAYHHLVRIPDQNEILHKYVKDAPELTDILYNASLMLLTTHPSLNDPVPLQPNIKEIGGYHVTPPKPLPSDLQKFLDEAKEGVVLFSMGSNLKSADFPKEKLDAILKTFGRLRQKVLWKFEADLPEKPKNVKILKWLPQSDILAHPNVKAFIGHGGLLGTIEAVYHGVPMVGVPVYWDQSLNMKTASRKGFAIAVPFAELTEEKFSYALNEILNNPSYQQNVKLRSKIMHSDPMKQLDAAVYWIEYVIKFKGAPHLRSAGLNLRWYQILNLDILLLIIVADVILFLVFYYIIKKILGPNKSVNQSSKKVKKS